MSFSLFAAEKHTVQRGENLQSIADKYNVSVDQLVKANPGCDNLFYVGLILNIPESAVTNNTISPSFVEQSKEIENSNLNSVPEDTYPDKSIDEFEKNRKVFIEEFSYCARSFEYVKESGSYGIAMTCFPWNIAPKLYAGLNFSPLNYNFGLNDFTYDEIKLGPAVGYYFTPQTFISLPFTVLCDVYSDDNNKVKALWGWALAPTLYVGNGCGLFFGLQFTGGFSSSKVSVGFRTGFYI